MGDGGGLMRDEARLTSDAAGLMMRGEAGLVVCGSMKLTYW